MTIRVVPWTIGGVARSAVRAVLAQPDLQARPDHDRRLALDHRSLAFG
jgi:hypothetical protein